MLAHISYLNISISRTLHINKARDKGSITFQQVALVGHIYT
jgi:hypothetical protein